RAAPRGGPLRRDTGGTAAGPAAPAGSGGRSAGPAVAAIPPGDPVAGAGRPAPRGVRAEDGDDAGQLRRAGAACPAGVPRGVGLAPRRAMGGTMTFEESPPTEAELREAELLARALEDPARAAGDPTAVDDALGAAWMLRASRRAELSELRARAVLDRAWPKRVWPVRAAAAALAAAAAAIAILAVRPPGPAELPPAPVPLLQAQLAAARPGRWRSSPRDPLPHRWLRRTAARCSRTRTRGSPIWRSDSAIPSRRCAPRTRGWRSARDATSSPLRCAPFADARTRRWAAMPM